MNALAPLSSHRTIGFDPEPYFFPALNDRSAIPSFRRGWQYSPRPEFTHTPESPCDALVAFRELWEAEGTSANYDLGELAESALEDLPQPSTREERLFQRFLQLAAAVLPRPIREREARWGIRKAVA